MTVPESTASGALARYVSSADAKNFQPVNITFALLPALAPELRKQAKRKRERHESQVALALKAWDEWLAAASPASAAAP